MLKTLNFFIKLFFCCYVVLDFNLNLWCCTACGVVELHIKKSNHQCDPLEPSLIIKRIESAMEVLNEAKQSVAHKIELNKILESAESGTSPPKPPPPPPPTFFQIPMLTIPKDNESVIEVRSNLKPPPKGWQRKLDFDMELKQKMM